MISLIKKKFYDDVPQYEISYAGSMIQSHQLETKDYALCIRTNLPFIELKDISFEETINMEFDGYKDQKGMNDYLIERYKKDIDKEALNLIKGTERFEKMNQKYTINGAFESKKYLLVPLDINACGTKEEILYNQKWIERYNYAQQINVLLNADYEAHAENIKRNVEQIINSRIREIVKMHIKNQLKKIRLLQRPMGGINDFEKKEVSFSSIKTFDRWYNGNISSTYKYGYSSRSTKAEMRCAFTGKSPCVVITINPENIEELSLICGCKVTDFPEQIQHWSKQEIYYGNPILENIDPMLWVIEDPFNKINFDITILLSKKAYLEICEEAGVRPDKLWEKERPLCHNSKEETCSGSYKYNNIGYNVYKQLKIKCLKCPWYKDNIESTKLKRN